MLDILYNNTEFIEKTYKKSRDASLALSQSVVSLCGKLIGHPGFIQTTYTNTTQKSSTIGINMGEHASKMLQFDNQEYTPPEPPIDKFFQEIDTRIGTRFNYFGNWDKQKVNALYGKFTQQNTKTCIESIEYQQRVLFETYKRLLKGVKRVALMDYPDYNNRGDNAVWIGERILLQKLGVEVVYFCT